MSTIDTVESVLAFATCYEHVGHHPQDKRLRRYTTLIKQHAALLEAVNRPVSAEQIEAACRAICKYKRHDPDERCRYSGGKLVRDKQGNFYPYWTTYKVDAKTYLEHHMAALREEVGGC